MYYLIVLIIILTVIIYNIVQFYLEINAIDAVITHADFEDPVLQKQLVEYSKLSGTLNAKKTWRWKSNGEAKYCIKSIQKYAPFFRNIFLVVSGPSQIPKWINEVNGVTIVYHSDFFKDTTHLPTFNSMSIEHNIHRIKGLSENFVYFNDDVFICKPVTIKDFINSDNKIIIGLEKGSYSPTGQPTGTDIGFHSAWKNTNKILDKIKKTPSREILGHIPQIQKKSVHRKIMGFFPYECTRTSSSKFRNTQCNLMSAGLAEWYSIYKNIGVINYQVDKGQFFITDSKEQNKKIYQHLKKKRYTFLNLQNSMEHTQDNNEFCNFLKEYFIF